MAEQREVLAPKGALTTTHAAWFREELSALFDREPEVVELNLEGVSEVDLSAIEVVYAAFLESRERPSTFRLAGRTDPAVGRVFQVGGFCHEMPTSGEELEQGLLRFDRREEGETNG